MLKNSLTASFLGITGHYYNPPYSKHMDEQPKDKKILLSLKPRLVEMLQQIIEQTGATGNQDAIRRAIADYYRRTLPAYTQRPPSARLNRTPEERAQDDLDAKASIIEKKRAQAVSMCEALGGEVRGGACHYKTFTKAYGTKVHSGVSSISLETISQDTLDKQFINTTREEAIEQGLL